LTFKKDRDITKARWIILNYVNNITPLGDKMVAISDHGIAIFARQDKSVFKTPSVTLFGVQQGDSFYTESDVSFSYLQNTWSFSYGAITNRKVKNMYRYRLVLIKTWQCGLTQIVERSVLIICLLQAIHFKYPHGHRILDEHPRSITLPLRHVL